MLQQLIVENKTANILLTFGDETDSEKPLSKAGSNEKAAKKSREPTDSGLSSVDGHTSHDQDSNSDRNATNSGNEEDNQSETDRSTASSKKRARGVLRVVGQPLRRNDSIHFASISDMSIMNTEQTENAVKRLRRGTSSGDSSGGDYGEYKRNASPHSQSNGKSLNDTDPLNSSRYSDSAKGKPGESIIEVLRSQVRAEAKVWSVAALSKLKSPGAGVASVPSETGYEADDPDFISHSGGGTVVSTASVDNDDISSGDYTSTVGIEHTSPQLKSMSEGKKSQEQKERNRLHAKLTRDRKKLFTSRMEDMIAYLEKQNKKRRDILVQMGIETVGADKVTLRESLIGEEKDKEKDKGKDKVKEGVFGSV